MSIFPLRRKAAVVRRRSSRPTQHRLIGLESLEHRLALAIGVEVLDNSNLGPAGAIFVTGHGIPGSFIVPSDLPQGTPPAELRVLDPTGASVSGKFTQAAVTIWSAETTGSTAKITTTVPHQLQVGDKVFVSGVAVSGYNGVFTVTKKHAGTRTPTEAYPGNDPGYFEYSVGSNLEPSSKSGAAYLPSLISTPTITAASANAGIVTVTLSGEANIPLNSPIFLQGLSTPVLAVAAPPTQPLTNVSMTQWNNNGTPTNIITCTTTRPHGLVPGQKITIDSSDPKYKGSYTVANTGLTLNSGPGGVQLQANQFTVNLSAVPGNASATGTVTPTNSGVIASSTAQLVVNIKSGTAPSSGQATLSGVLPSKFDGSYTVSTIPATAGLPSTAAWLTANNSPFNTGDTGGGGTLSFSSVDLNGVQEVTQNSSTNPALMPNQFQYSLTGANGTATLTNAVIDVVSLNPVALASLPKSGSQRPTVTLDSHIEDFSSQLVQMVTPTGKQPFPLGISPGTASLSNLGTPPFAFGAQTGTSVADIVEFYYAGSGNSTFDLSGVDGFALPLTLNASSVTQGVSQVGINTSLGASREQVGTAFSQFITKEPVAVKDDAKFGRLLYTGPTSVNPLTVAAQSAQGTPLTGVQVRVVQAESIVAKATTTAAHGLVPGQAITVSGAGSPYDGSFTVTATGLTDTTLTDKEFTYAMNGTSKVTATATVTPTNSGVIATSQANLAVQLAPGSQAPTAGSTVQLVNVPNGPFAPAANVNAFYTVQSIPSNAGLPDTTVVLASTTGQTFTVGNSTGGGTLQTPVFVTPPTLPDNQFYVIAAPKDWLVQQPHAAAILDPMVSWWDTTIDAFFTSGNFLQVAVGSPLASRSYTGKYNTVTKAFDFRPGTATSGTPAFSIAKPTPENVTPALPNDPAYNQLANALWVWAQAAIPKGDHGLVWDQIVQAFCRGVALDGVFTQAPTEGQSNAAWTNTSNWYRTGTYCPYSKFLHFGTLGGGTDFTGTRSIYTGGLAYGFSEDEVPIGSDGKKLSNPLGGPSKMDSTVPDGATMTLTVNPWTGSVPQAPFVRSIDTVPQETPPGTPTPTTASNLTWTVTFSQPVKGVTLKDFTYDVYSGPLGLDMKSVTPNSGTAPSQTWTVTADVVGTGSGVLGVNLIQAGSITDASGTPLYLPAKSVGEMYSVNTNPVGPTATIAVDGTSPTDAASVPFKVTFRSAVTGLTTKNFTTVASGVTGSFVQGVSGSGTNYTVSVNTGSGSGTLALRLASDAGLVPAPTGLPVTSAAYQIEKDVPTDPPAVLSIATEGSAATNASSVSWTVTLSEPVTGLTAANLSVVNGGLGGSPAITGVTPTSSSNTATWTVTASTGTGSGTLQLNLANSTNVRDADSQVVTNVPFAGGIYSIDRTAPVARAILRGNANPTSQSLVSWTVTFSEAVSGLTKQNLQLVPKGLSGAEVRQVAPVVGSAPSAAWTVTASTGSGLGTLRLDLTSGAGITDPAGNALAGPPLAGQTYTVQRSTATIVSAPISFMTTAGSVAKLAWPMQPFADSNSMRLNAALSVSPAAGGMLRAISRDGVTVTPSGSRSAELQFSGTVAALNAYFTSTAGFISYAATAGSLAPRTLTLSAQGRDGLSGLATAALLVRSAAPQAPAPAVRSRALLGLVPAGQPVVITYSQLVAATGATQTTSRSIQFMLAGLSSGRLEVWSGSRWSVVPSVTNIPLLAPGGQIRWTPPAAAVGVRPAFSVKTWDGWRMSGVSHVSVHLTR